MSSPNSLAPLKQNGYVLGDNTTAVFYSFGVMNPIFKSTVFQKFIVALTGIGLCVFVLLHMSGNLLLFLGPDIYNQYSHQLITNPLIIPMEIGLAATFIIHILFAIQLSRANRIARPSTPSPSPSCVKAARFGSRSMIYTGLLVLVFLIFHLITFKYGTYYETNVHGVVMRDIYRLVYESFQSPIYTGLYLISLVLLGLHLSHGFSALFQTLGIGSVRGCILKKVGYGFALLISLGFISQPLYLLFVRGK